MNNAGFLSTQNVRENQLANLSKQIDNLREENDRLEDINEELMEERNRLNNIINEFEKSLKNLKGYYDQISFNTKAEFDDEEQVNRFWQEYGKSKVVDYYFNKLQELKVVDKD